MLDLNDFTEINNIVFGGAGFLGSHLIDKLLYNGERTPMAERFVSRFTAPY